MNWQPHHLDILEGLHTKQIIPEIVKRAALKAAHHSWYSNPSFDRAVMAAVEAAFKIAAEGAKGRD